MAREIINLQFGHYSNFVGTHWWNAQELSFEYVASKPTEIDNDIMFREGLSPTGQVTYTPRLVLADLKGSLKTLPKDGSLYETPDNDITPSEIWADTFDIQAKPQIEKNFFQKKIDLHVRGRVSGTPPLETIFEVWSDFLYTKFHPRTVNLVERFEHNDKETPFNLYHQGISTWAECSEEFDNKIRQYAEECDNLQGFHVLLDATNGFAGMAASCLQELSDEYVGKTIFAMPMIPPYYEDYNWFTEQEQTKSIQNDTLRVVNLVFTMAQLKETTSFFTPLSVAEDGWRKPGRPIDFNHVKYDERLPYHTTAILAAVIDTFSIRYRMRFGKYSMGDLCTDLSSPGCNMVAASTCFPFSLNEESYLIDCLDNWDGPLTRSVTPSCTIGERDMRQSVVLRGIPESRMKKAFRIAGKQLELAAYQCSNIVEMLRMYYDFATDQSRTGLCSYFKTFNTCKPFPNIFKREIYEDGYVTRDLRSENMGVDSVPVLAGLHQGSFVGNSLDTLHKAGSRIRYPQIKEFSQLGITKEEFGETMEKLLTFRENYNDTNVL